ncbi:hypothetical protein [Microbacterium sp. GXS0129]|uniref:hypothetical protein n=1 Tax=Microbacterium sp. GXS0129 TaxID=3377836 RepID=UPI00383AB314
MKKDNRLFARLDLDYADHPKIAGLSDGAFRAHVEMILYSRRYLTDGRIPVRIANRFGIDVLEELTSNDETHPSLVILPGGDYEIHDFADMQETKAEVEKKRQVNSENGRKGGRPRKTHSVTDSASQNETETKAETEAETETETETNTPPNGGGARKRGTRIPEPFIVTSAMREWAASETPHADVDACTRQFVDYWRAESGSRASKRDWVAAWRNWLRREEAPARTSPQRVPTRTEQNLAVVAEIAAREAAEQRGITS